MAHTPDPPPTAAAADEALAAPRRGFLAAGWAKFSDNAIPSLVVAVIAGLVLFLFGETSDRISETGDRITRLEESIDTRIIRLEETIDTRIIRLEESIDARFAAVDARLAKLEGNQQEIAVTLTALVAEFAAFEEDVDNRFEAIETRLAKLEENQQEIAVTLARLVTLFEAHFEAPATASG